MLDNVKNKYFVLVEPLMVKSCEGMVTLFGVPKLTFNWLCRDNLWNY